MSEPMNLPADHLERTRALDPTCSFICEAPAGSGKTELLTQRFLTLLSRVERPEEILAITFTRKATGEMRERIVRALHEAQAPKPERAHKVTTWNLARAVINRDKQLNWQLLDNPVRLRIQTFDSLCAALTHHLPLESALGAQPQIQEDAKDLYREAVRALLATLEADVPWRDSLKSLLALLDNRFDRFENLLIDMLGRRESWLPLLAYGAYSEEIRCILEDNFRRVICERIAYLREKIPLHVHKDIVSLASYCAANLRTEGLASVITHCQDMDLKHSQLPAAEPDNIKVWLGITGLFVTGSGTWRKAASVKIGIRSGDTREEKSLAQWRKNQWKQLIDVFSCRDGMLDAFKHLRNLPAPKLDDEQWHILKALFELLPVLVAQLTLVFRTRNVIDFAELSLAARRALGDTDAPSDLALRIDYQLKHILVDEFQDTSISQIELLNSLTQGWMPDDGRTLFCVGDAMQSIYAFRGANVGLFLRCKEQGLANVQLEILQLQTNFRSQAGVVDWINRVFASAFPSENNISNGAVRYSPAVAIHPREDGKAVFLHAFIDHENLQEEARYLLGIIRKSRQDLPNATIAVLVRSRDHAAHIVPLLKEHKIAYRAVDLEPLHNHAVIQDLLALTRALLHLADRTAWLAILRAPWCGLTLADLEAVANIQPLGQVSNNKKPSFLVVLEQCLLALHLSGKSKQAGQYKDSAHEHGVLTVNPIADFFIPETIQIGQHNITLLSEDGFKRLQRVTLIMQSACAQRERKSFRQWVEGCWLQLGGPAVLENETALVNAQVYFELLEKWQYPSSLPSFDILLTEVEKLYARCDPHADDSLQIMTIHKSKGLEFDVVIVPALDRKSRADDAPVLIWQQRLNSTGHTDILMAPLTNTGGMKHPSYNHLRQENTKKAQLENCRLLYVACTRARKKLYLSAQVKQDAQETARFKHPVRSSLLNSIWDVVQTRMTPVPSKQLRAAPTSIKPSQPRALYRLDSNWQQPDRPEGHLLDDYIPQFHYQELANRINLHWEDATSRHTGTVIHRYLQAFAETGLAQWSATRINRCQTNIEKHLISLGVGLPNVPAACQRVLLILCRVLNDAQAHKILAADYSFCANEFCITLNTETGPNALVLDRVFQEADGQLWVVDYKTSEPAPGQLLDEFYQQELATYQPKMQLYKKALQELGFALVRTSLYFPVTGGWLEYNERNIKINSLTLS